MLGGSHPEALLCFPSQLASRAGVEDLVIYSAYVRPWHFSALALFLSHVRNGTRGIGCAIPVFLH